MKQILEYLLSKKNAKINQFVLPDDPLQITGYLEEQGFKEFECNPNILWEVNWKNFEKEAEESNMVMYDDNKTKWVRFCKQGIVSKDNPVWKINGLRRTLTYSKEEYFDDNDHSITDYKSFKTQVENHFNRT